MNNGENIHQLEEQAEKEREQLHATAEELRAKFAATRKKLRPSTMMRERFGAASAFAAVLGLFLGYGLTGLFVRR